MCDLGCHSQISLSLCHGWPRINMVCFEEWSLHRLSALLIGDHVLSGVQTECVGSTLRTVAVHSSQLSPSGGHNQGASYQSFYICLSMQDGFWHVLADSEAGQCRSGRTRLCSTEQWRQPQPWLAWGARWLSR